MDKQTLADRYRIEARIGQGGMAEVYRAFDPALDRQVAVKVLLPPFDRDAGFVARFRREAQAAGRLNHPNIVGVYDAGSVDETQYIVMEYIEGRTLASFLADGGKPTPRQAVELTLKVAAALQVAHAHGIVHRDIKPANIMVTRDGEVKVMDFGIARLQTDATAPQTSSVIGTPAYFSPEQAQGQPVDERSDIYSLGCVLYELLCHRQPFTGDTPVAIAYKQVNENPVPPSQVNPAVPPVLDAVVMKCMAKNPANRYATAHELMADLERVRAGQDVEATPLLPAAGAAGGATTQVIARQPTQVMAPPEPEGSSKKVWLGALIGILVVAILAGGGYLLAKSLNSDDTPTTFTLDSWVGKDYAVAQATLRQQGLNVEKVTQTSDRPEGEILSQSPKAGTEMQSGQTVTFVVAVAPKTVKVPDLTCLTPDEAAAELGDDLQLGTQTTAPSADESCSAGEIISQDPAAGSQVVPGTTDALIAVTVNPETVTIGDYTCETIGHAKAELRQLGLSGKYGGTSTPLPQCPKSQYIASQSPEAGSEVAVGGSVTLFTSSDASPSSTETPSP